MPLEQILQNKNPKQLKALFSFYDEPEDLIVIKFGLWCRNFFPEYFESPDAGFHKNIDTANLRVYLGVADTYTNIAFRGAAKTARTKLFMAYVICNDMLHRRKYMKCSAFDINNSKQTVTDVFNMLINPEIQKVYPEIFSKEKGVKREETMSRFATATGVKLVADTVGKAQRGALQNHSRPDFIWFDDFENRKTLRSPIITKAISDNMEEARTGLAKGGGCIYTCNYVSERGIVHQLVKKETDRNIVHIIPIIFNGVPTWSRYSVADIENMKKTDSDFEGERLCNPSAGTDIMFDRSIIDRAFKAPVLKELNGFRMYHLFDPSHRYGSGHDVAGGVGLDSSTSVFIDFSTVPARVCATYDNNTIKPDIFGDEIYRQAQYYSEPIVAPEQNNHGHATIGRLKQIYPNEKIFHTLGKATTIDERPPKNFGWSTNSATKPMMLAALIKAVHDGLLLLECPKLIAEARSYTRDDLMDPETDPRLTTRHFDLLMAAAIAWQMRWFADISEVEAREISKKEAEDYHADFNPFALG